MTGIVTGFKIGKNRNSTKNVVILQVRLRSKNDIQTVQLMNPPGDDSVPPIGSKVVIVKVSENYKIAIAQSDNIEPVVDIGEKMIYSQAGGIIKAFIKFLNDGILEINGNNDFAVRFNALKTGFDTLKSDFNTFLVHVHGASGTPPVPPAIPSAASIDSSKVQEVKII